VSNSSLTGTKVPTTPPDTGARARITLAFGSTWGTSMIGGFNSRALLSVLVMWSPFDVSLAGSSTGDAGGDGAVWSILIIRLLLSWLALPAWSICWTR
jgi:hypothetical protein